MKPEQRKRGEQEEREQVIQRRDDDEQPAREGDVLGISDTTAESGAPPRMKPGGGRPSGIDVRDHATGIGDVPQRSGATGVDMGGGGSGTHVAPRTNRPGPADERDPTE